MRRALILSPLSGAEALDARRPGGLGITSREREIAGKGARMFFRDLQGLVAVIGETAVTGRGTRSELAAAAEHAIPSDGGGR